MITEFNYTTYVGEFKKEKDYIFIQGVGKYKYSTEVVNTIVPIGRGFHFDILEPPKEEEVKENLATTNTLIRIYEKDKFYIKKYYQGGVRRDKSGNVILRKKDSSLFIRINEDDIYESNEIHAISDIEECISCSSYLNEFSHTCKVEKKNLQFIVCELKQKRRILKNLIRKLGNKEEDSFKKEDLLPEF